jgi:AP-4 complex subunit mu-1
MPVVSQLFVLSQRGDSIISHDFRGELPRGTAEIFFRRVSSGAVSPVFEFEGVKFFSIKKAAMFFVATATSGSAAGSTSEDATILELLSRVIRVFKDFAGSLSEETIRKHFPLFYEILDEAVDFGFVQTTSTANLRLVVRSGDEASLESGTSSIRKFEAAAIASITNFVQHKLGPNSATFIQQLPDMIAKQLPPNLAASVGGVAASVGLGGPASKTMSSSAVAKPLGSGANEIFVDIVETLSFTSGAPGGLGGYGQLQVSGGIYVKSFLSGCPGIVLEVDTPHAMTQFVLHPQTDGDEFEKHRVLSLATTPEGESRLLAYRGPLVGAMAPMQLISVVAEAEKDRLDVTLRLAATGVPDSAAIANLEVTAVLAGKASSVSGGGDTAELGRDGRTVVWRVKKLVGGQEATLKAKVWGTGGGLRLVQVALKFEISMFTLGEVAVKQLRVDGFSNPNRWVRYVTQANNYTFRL